MDVSQTPQTSKRISPRPRTLVGVRPVSAAGVVILGAFMAIIALLALYGLWRFWPPALPAKGASTAKFSYFGWRVALTTDQQFFVMAALAGVVGAMLHGLRSLSAYVGERYLFRSWIPYYVLLPLVGALIATIVYLVLRAGLLPGSTESGQPNPYGIAAISALVGMFSAQAAEKLKAVFETLFTKAGPGSEPLTDVAAPVISSFNPQEGPVGTPVTISGDNLTSVTRVAFTGAVAPQFRIESENLITVQVPDGATSGPIILRAGQEQAESDSDFTVTPAQP